MLFIIQIKKYTNKIYISSAKYQNMEHRESFVVVVIATVVVGLRTLDTGNVLDVVQVQVQVQVY